MEASQQSLWKTNTAQQLVIVLAAINDAATMQKFLRDVMTEKEIIEISSRLEAARLLRDGATYTEIIEKTKLSSRTIARINGWIKNGSGGYTSALDTLPAHHNHLPPARAE